MSKLGLALLYLAGAAALGCVVVMWLTERLIERAVRELIESVWSLKL